MKKLLDLFKIKLIKTRYRIMDIPKGTSTKLLRFPIYVNHLNKEYYMQPLQTFSPLFFLKK